MTCSIGWVCQIHGGRGRRTDTWEKDFLRDMLPTPTFQKPGNGGFSESYLEHCAAQMSSTANSYAVGGVAMMQGLTEWWLDAWLIHVWWLNAGAAPAKSRWHLPSSLNEAALHQCNPT